MIKIKICKLSDKAVMPTKGTDMAAGFDLYATNTEVFVMNETKMIHTDLVFEIPEGYFGAIVARSSLATKLGIVPATCMSVIDSDYRGEVTIPLRCLNPDKVVGVQEGDRVAQLLILPVPEAEIEEVETVSATQRGTGGYGSTGK